MDYDPQLQILVEAQQWPLGLVALVIASVAVASVATVSGALGKFLWDASHPEHYEESVPPHTLSHAASGVAQALAPAPSAVGLFLPPPPTDTHNTEQVAVEVFDVHGAWLDFEKSLPVEDEEGVCVAVGSSTRKVYHRPSCVWAKRILPANAVKFATGADVESSGYRPCRHCDPARLDA